MTAAAGAVAVLFLLMLGSLASLPRPHAPIGPLHRRITARTPAAPSERLGGFAGDGHGGSAWRARRRRVTVDE